MKCIECNADIPKEHEVNDPEYYDLLCNKCLQEFEDTGKQVVHRDSLEEIVSNIISELDYDGFLKLFNYLVEGHLSPIKGYEEYDEYVYLPLYEE